MVAGDLLYLSFACLITLQFLVVVSHDWLEIPGWTHGRQVQNTVGRRKLLLATLINAIFPGVAVGFVFCFGARPRPWFVDDYWVIYCAVTVLSAVFMWWVPYFFGADAKTRDEYARMYRGTLHWLPGRDGNPRPNRLHLCFHGLFIVTLALAILLWMD